MNAQTLLAKIVDMAGGPAESGYVLALDDRSLDGVPDTFQTARASYQVYRPQSELGLRRLLWKSRGAPFVALVERRLADRLPPDIVRRARGGQVHALELRDVLALALGVSVVPPDDPAVAALVVEQLDALHEALARRTLPTVVSRDLLEQLLLEVVVSADIREAQPPALLADWVRNPPTERWAQPVRDLLRRNLPQLHGSAGAVLAWALDDQARLRDLVVRGLLLAVETDDLPPAVWGRRLRGLLSDPALGLAEGPLRTLLAGLAIGACEALVDEAGPFLEEAEEEGREKLPPRVLAASRVLPLGLSIRMTELAKRAAAGGTVSASDVVWLREHRAARFHGEEIEVVEEMARLSRYLGEAPAVAPADAGMALVDRVRAYQEHGAFADLAAMRLRRAMASTSQHEKEAQAVLTRWRDRRDTENQAFARVLAAGYAKALFAEGITPLSRVWKHVVLPALAEDGQRGLYLVVLDGCSYPVFLELVGELARRPRVPIGIAPPASLPRAHGLPALSPLPTVTSHARGAVFLGEIPKDPLVPEAVFRDEGEGTTDRGRFDRNPFLGSRSRQLFLKGDLGDGGAALRAALADQSLEVVAAVFNAVDDRISSQSTGTTFRVRPESIEGFIQSLETALESKRRILLTADHGFTPYLSKDLRAGNGAAHRYVALDEGQPAPDGFEPIDLEGLGGDAPRRVAFAWRLGTYLRRPQVGFHGGCGLEEMVVPLAWLARDGVPGDLPTWWDGTRVAEAAEGLRAAPRPLAGTARPDAQPAAVTRPAARPAVAARRPSPPRDQHDLFLEPPSASECARLLGLSEAVTGALDGSERTALAWLAEVGSARVSELAAAIGRAPGRLPGFMTKLQRKLHKAGAPCFGAEPLPDGEVQYVWVPPSRGSIR